MQNRTGVTTFGIASFAQVERYGERRNTANTPKRAIAISKPMARAISFPLNHFAIAFDTVTPPISTPHPKIMNPIEANLAVGGKLVQNESRNLYSPQSGENRSLIAYNFIEAPITIIAPDKIPVKRIPILSSIIPAKIRKNAKTLRKYSELQNVPYVSADHPLLDSSKVDSGDSTSTNM